MEFIKATCLTLVTEIEKCLQEKLDLYQQGGRYLFVAQIISSGIETCDKLHAHLERIRKCTDRLNNLRKVQDIPWTEVNWKDLHERTDKVYRKLMLSGASVLVPLEPLPASRYWPDFFGQLYSFVARETYFAMARGDEELFKKIFPPLFASSILANQRLRESLKDKDARTMIAWSSAPLEDIVALSGYAKLFSELDGNAFWPIVETTWDDYLVGFEDRMGPLKLITAILEYRIGDFFTSSRDLERTGWQQNFDRLLRDRGILRERYSDYDRAAPQLHKSRLIQEVTRGGIWTERASDVFLVEYVMPKLAGEQIKFPYSATNLARALSRNVSANGRENEYGQG